MKTCTKCHIAKPPEDFYFSRTSADGRSGYCGTCERARQKAHRTTDKGIATKRAYREKNQETIAAYKRAYAAENREQIQTRVRDWRLKKKYGLSTTEWDAMFEAQGRVCGICGDDDPRTKNGWHTDHCHEGGQVRGILCHHCNLALGHIKDSPDVALKLYSYLSGKLPFAP